MAREEEKQSFTYHPLPSPGDIVWCFFPESIGTPGPKPRPAIVIKTSPETHEVMVVYGTSQKVDKIYPSEFLMDFSDPGFSASNLSFSTKFDMSREVALPFNTDFFGPAPNVVQQRNSPAPKMGVLHASYMKKLAEIYKRIH